MKGKSFARLTDCGLREAWEHEAHEFTPWLAENIDYLSEALGLELDPPETEVAVEQFSADIVANETGTGDRVLIENQLENSDHNHLGQILTHLAGLDAKRVVWIARNFQEAHCSAIRWLNDNTGGDFAFFAVRLRVVRIGDSPLAPVFEVVEKPNAWERRLGRTVNEAEAERTRLRAEFWSRYLEKNPGKFKPGSSLNIWVPAAPGENVDDSMVAGRTSNVWVPMTLDGSIVLSLALGSRGSMESGMFLRAGSPGDAEDVAAFMERNAGKLEEAFGPSEAATAGHYYWISKNIRLQDKERWDELIGWMEDRRQLYCETIKAVSEEESGGPQ